MPAPKMYFGFFSLFIVLGHMILLHLESPDMQLSNHRKFPFWDAHCPKAIHCLWPVHCLYA